MKINKDIKTFIAAHNATIKDVLTKLNSNREKIIFVVDDNGVICGSVTDGDIRRFLIGGDNYSESTTIEKAMNKNYHALPLAEVEVANRIQNKGFRIVPLLDAARRIAAVAVLADKGFSLGGKEISDDSPVFIIAEIGNNHNGSLANAKTLIDIACSAGVDCVKFQLRSIDHTYRKNAFKDNSDFDLGAQYTIDLLRKFSLSNADLMRAFDYCLEKKIIPLCTPWDTESVKLLERYGIEGYKVASADLTNTELLECLAKTGKPLICSTGMSKESEIIESASILQELGANVAYLHCNSTYPTPLKDVNLNYIKRLKSLTGTVVGYSGHERGYIVPIAAVAMGAKIIEKHITLDRNQEGVDHKVSLLPNELNKMVESLRDIEVAIGDLVPSAREVSQGEMMNRENLAKSLVAATPIKKNKIINRSMISIRSPGNGIQPNRMSELLGRKAVRNIKQGEIFLESDVRISEQKKTSYQFKRPFGLPVRYHDYKTMCEGVKLDFIEFHLSYSDLNIDFRQYLKEQQKIEFAVHAPELFENDHILDLGSSNEAYRKESIHHVERVIKLTKELAPYFSGPKNPIIILNPGGWSTTSFMETKEKMQMYRLIRKSLDSIDWSGITLAIQTMPPFPWHFGGQSFHNAFVDADEILEFIKETNYKICLDISHSMMSCNYYKSNFKVFLEKILPVSVHLHIVDAKGVDGEGVNIGSGDVDFYLLKTMLTLHAPGVQFIPEVWQGHKNSGEGFWKALKFLEELEI
jgi:sialic acid synthase SpsE/sugar phosphate isomerase/epimerase